MDEKWWFAFDNKFLLDNDEDKNTKYSFSQINELYEKKNSYIDSPPPTPMNTKKVDTPTKIIHLEKKKLTKKKEIDFYKFDILEKDDDLTIKIIQVNKDN